jgi:hypothetical protein
MTANDNKYLRILLDALGVCADYQPKFGHGRKGGLSLAQFQRLYEADSFYSWFGLSSPLMYAAHKAAGGMTSVYRQIGIGCQRVFVEVLKDSLGLDDQNASWSYTVRSRVSGSRRLSLDGRIPTEAVSLGEAKTRVIGWLESAADAVALPAASWRNLQGAVFEVRQGYKSKDSKRQNADIANAAHAYAHNYLPVALLLSSQIDEDVAERYERARWLLLRGILLGTPLDSAYVFLKEVIGYDLAGFFQRNSVALKTEVETVMRKLLGEE